MMAIFHRANDGTCAVGTLIETCEPSDLAARLGAANDAHGFTRVGALPTNEYTRRLAQQSNPSNGATR